MSDRLTVAGCAVAMIAAALAPHATAEEGMWPPALLSLERAQQTLGAPLDRALFQRLQLASVKFGGASAFFVSLDGLMMTNHHVGLRCIQSVSTVAANYYVNGYVAASRADELRCPYQEARVLMSYTDITDEIARAAAKRPAERALAEAQAQSEIENRCNRETRLTCEVVALSGGSRRLLYRYRKYDDVRLVASPEAQLAYFGGDPDNFEYPRYGLDVALFRVYEQGRPVIPPAFLRLAAKSIADGDPVIVSGHPFRTNRGLTVPQLEAARDVILPGWLQTHERRIKLLFDYRRGSAERGRRASNLLFGARNSLKRDNGFLQALRSPRLIAAQRARFDALAATLPPEEAKRLARLLESAAQLADMERRHWVEGHHVSHFTGSRLFEWAVLLTRWAEQAALPEGSRLEDFRGARLKATESWIASETPVYADLEAVVLADRWAEAAAALGAAHVYVRALAGVDVAALIRDTGLAEPAARKGLLAAGPQAIRESTDPLLSLARRLEPELYRVRVRFEREIREPAARIQAELARLRAVAHGDREAPDADGSLRFAFGRVAGYREEAAERPWATRLGGMYERAERAEYKAPDYLPPLWRARRDKVPMHTPLNFVSTLDHSGGNSGSPVVNVRGEWVGVLHDGNRQYLGTQYVYSSEQARTIAAHADAIMVWLGTVHGALGLITEIASR